MLPTKFRFIWPSGFRGEDFWESTNQKQDLPVGKRRVGGPCHERLWFCPDLLTNMAATGNSCFWLADFFKIFSSNQPIRNKICLWWPCLLTDRDKMSKLYRGPSIDDSYQVSVHLAKRFQRRRLFLEINQSTRHNLFINIYKYLIILNYIGGVVVSVLASSDVDHGFRSNLTKIGIFCFSKHAATRNKSKDWLVQKQYVYLRTVVSVIQLSM
jgi:hypothetical protein